mgnify:CR=1 FL=1
MLATKEKPNSNNVNKINGGESIVKKSLIIIYLISIFFSLSCKKHREYNNNKSKYRITDKNFLIKKLFNSIKNNNLIRVKEIIKMGVGANSRNYNGETALSYAVSHSFPTIVTYLIKNGAMVNEKNLSAETSPLHLVPSVLLAKILIENKANLEIKDYIGETPLIYAIKSKNINLIKFLLLKGADINTKNDKGETILMYMAQFGDLKIIKFLISNGASVNLINNFDSSVKQNGTGYSTALDYAIYTRTKNKKNLRIISFLRSKGAKTFKYFYKRGYRKRR